MRAGRRILLLFSILCIFQFSVFAQKSKSQLQQEKQQNEEKIKEALTVRATRSAMAKLDGDPSRLLN